VAPKKKPLSAADAADLFVIRHPDLDGPTIDFDKLDALALETMSAKEVRKLVETLATLVWEQSLLLNSAYAPTARLMYDVNPGFFWKLNGKDAATKRHKENADNRQQVINAWLSGNHRTRAACAREMSMLLGIDVDTARKYLRNTPEPPRS